MSSPLQLDLRRPRALDAALLALAALAAYALWLSAAPRLSLLLVPVLLAIGAARRKRSIGRTLVLRGDGSAALLDAEGAETDAVPTQLQRRGPLTVLTLQIRGRMHVHLFTPATLPREDARRLRLWFGRHRPQPALPAAVPHV